MKKIFCLSVICMFLAACGSRNKGSTEGVDANAAGAQTGTTSTTAKGDTAKTEAAPEEKKKKKEGLSDERIRQNIASTFGVKETDFTISEKSYVHPRTNFTIKMKSGKEYRCYIMGGGFLTMGATTAPVCNKKGEIGGGPTLQ